MWTEWPTIHFTLISGGGFEVLKLDRCSLFKYHQCLLLEFRQQDNIKKGLTKAIILDIILLYSFFIFKK